MIQHTQKTLPEPTLRSADYGYFSVIESSKPIKATLRPSSTPRSCKHTITPASKLKNLKLTETRHLSEVWTCSRHSCEVTTDVQRHSQNINQYWTQATLQSSKEVAVKHRSRSLKLEHDQFSRTELIATIHGNCNTRIRLPHSTR